MSIPADKDLHPGEYYAWVNMKTRCTNPNYHLWHRYGGRGITVADAWVKSFKRFFADVGPKPFKKAILDRVDNDKGYSPGNVKWSSPKESSRNRTVVKPVAAFGNEMLLPDWAEKSDRNRKTIWRRLKDGWPADMAIAAPPMPVKFRRDPTPIKSYEAAWRASQ
ncbi:MAG: hypothetical protein ABL936_15370 [Aestuariivirga sp.]